MEIRLNTAGKKFRQTWVFRNLDFVFPHASATAILGPNGSGKSTLAQILCGLIPPSEGLVTHEMAGKILEAGEIYKYVAYAAPYAELFNSFSAEEVVRLHSRFRKFRTGISPGDVVSESVVKAYRNKPVEVLSSGMKQRLKLALAIMTDSDLLFLDEPLTNLDEEGRKWYAGMMERHSGGRTVIVCSNHDEEEHNFCALKLRLTASNPL